MNADFRVLCHEVEQLAREVGTYIKAERKKLDGAVSSEAKGLHDYVTRFDRESERRIVERLRLLLPYGDFIAEEGTAAQTGRSRYTWIVDPIDGTTNFIHGFSPTCISIGLQDNELSEAQRRPVMALGVVYEMWADECFAANRDEEGAHLNDSDIHVSNTPTVYDSLIATGFPYSDFEKIDAYMAFLAWTMQNSHGVRRLGSAAADLVYTACGRVDAFYEYGLKPYDVAAGAYIVEKAGGKVGDFGGGNGWLFGGEMLATNALVFDEMVEALAKYQL